MKACLKLQPDVLLQRLPANFRKKNLLKAFMVMENQINLQHNTLFHLDDSMAMYVIMIQTI